MKRATNNMHSHVSLVALLLLARATCLAVDVTPGTGDSTLLRVDAREASQRILHATLRIPARPGPLTLLYPKWIPGEHGPTGPISDLAGLKMSAGGKSVSWQRDPADNYKLNLTVPDGASSVEVALDFLLPTDPEGFSFAASSSASLAVISWNTLLLYPQGAAASALTYTTHLELPAGWKYATALKAASESADGIQFEPVTLETLIDSPLSAGVNLRTIELAPSRRLNIVADSAAALEIKPADVKHFSRLVAEEEALFGAHHFNKYDFLLTLSDQVAHFGLEHHESSDNRAPERMLIDEEVLKASAGLMPHEMVHSWNGKYRRPADIATPDYQQPMKTELLWVYEGLTTYLGEMLTARCGLWNATNYLEHLALVGAMLDYQRGRTWRPLADTTVAAHLLYYARPEGASWRRGVDFYPEGELIWLEADVTIRAQTGGKRSLDDFCHRFFGGESTPPRVVPYGLDDVIKALNEVAPFDWRGFFQQRVYAVNPQAPLGGIERGGWRLVYRDTESDMLKNFESNRKLSDFSFSLGFSVKEDGAIQDVIPGLPAARAGIGPGMKLTAVNHRRWKPELIRAAIKEAKESHGEVELLVENGDFFKTCQLDYREGERYPHLERDANKPDLLAEIIKPRAK